MTVATGYLGKREFHGALAKHSPYACRPTACVACGGVFSSTCEITDEICNGCFALGWRPPGWVDPAAQGSTWLIAS